MNPKDLVPAALRDKVIGSAPAAAPPPVAPGAVPPPSGAIPAISTKSLAHWSPEARAAESERVFRHSQKKYASKTFEQLAPTDKDELVRLLAIRFGMIQPSPPLGTPPSPPPDPKPGA